MIARKGHRHGPWHKRPWSLYANNLSISILLFQAIVFLSFASNNFDTTHRSNHCEETSIVAACMNRNTTIILALESWIKAECVGEIILVDWSSEPPLVSNLPPKILSDSRLHVARVQEVNKWTLSWAVNFAASLATSKAILKLDCDTIISSDFISYHPFSRGVFYSGNTSDFDENSHHLNGILYTYSSDFWKVGGYDERIQSYGWEDDDLFNRLGSIGLRSKPINMARIHHLFHGDKMRSARSNEVLFSTQYNRFLSQYAQPWNADSPHIEFERTSLSSQHTEARVVHSTPSLQSQLSQSAIDNALHKAAFLHIQWYGVCEGHEICSSEYIKKAVSSYENARNSPSELMLVIHVHGDLEHRIRALLMAASYAKDTGRWLRIIWERDKELNATLPDLMDKYASGLHDVWELFDFRELHPETFQMFDATMDVQSISGCRQHFYINAALNPAFSSMPEELLRKHAKQLIPSPGVDEYLKQILGDEEIPSIVGIYCTKDCDGDTFVSRLNRIEVTFPSSLFFLVDIPSIVLPGQLERRVLRGNRSTCDSDALGLECTTAKMAQFFVLSQCVTIMHL